MINAKSFCDMSEDELIAELKVWDKEHDDAKTAAKPFQKRLDRAKGVCQVIALHIRSRSDLKEVERSLRCQEY